MVLTSFTQTKVSSLYSLHSPPLSSGLLSLYSGYTTTLTMTVPYHFIYFPVYEALKKMLKADSSEHDVSAHLLAGGGAGALAAGLTNPLDVARTRLQTMHELGNPAYKALDL